MVLDNIRIAADIIYKKISEGCVNSKVLTQLRLGLISEWSFKGSESRARL